MAESRTARRGRFITLEGGEGAGKSTQAGLLAAALGKAGKTVTVTREPGGSPGAEEIRDLLVTGEAGRWDPVSEALLLYAARRDHWLRLIEPALDRGDWVICDRFSDSTLVYQGIGRGVDLAVLRDLHNMAMGETAPDLTLLFDLPAETGLARGAARDADTNSQETRFERMTLEFHQRLRQGFTDLAAVHPERIVTVDATAEIDQVAGAVLDIVRTRLLETSAV